MAEDFGKQVDLLTLQIDQLAGRSPNRPLPNGQQRRPLPAANWNGGVVGPSSSESEWKKRAEDAEQKVIQLEEKIQKLAVAVKTDREKTKKAIEDWKAQAELADAKTLAYETKLHEAVNLLKKERTKTMHSQSDAFLKEQIEKKVSEQLEAATVAIRQELQREKELNQQLKSRVDFLTAQLDEAKDNRRRSGTPATAAPTESFEQSQKRNKLVALYDYPGGGSEDINFGEGEVLTLLKKYSDGWWLAEKNGRIGRVPSNFVEELDASKRINARAIGDFKGESKKDLSFPGSAILLVWKTQEDWWVAEYEGKVGWVPSNFLEEINPGS
eukprot:TRINITY_DN1691_c0_g1_i3.p2 TRINITY_DN1691_c0_g1~~TRINITY_DN1691_c0_g1_i3.p2  ORF type:complete len:327 (+),score=109.97 TRINITY_DN1691_c0_g1_i3:114-1094(+)